MRLKKFTLKVDTKYLQLKIIIEIEENAKSCSKNNSVSRSVCFSRSDIFKSNRSPLLRPLRLFSFGKQNLFLSFSLGLGNFGDDRVRSNNSYFLFRLGQTHKEMFNSSILNFGQFPKPVYEILKLEILFEII